MAAEEKTVFISYSSQDRQFVNRIVRALEDMGIRCWQAPAGIPAGSSYAREIPRAIRECQVFLLFLSKTSQESIWVEKETDSAISNRRNLIPFQIDTTPLNETFRFYLNNVQMISYAENPQMALKELGEELTRLVGSVHRPMQLTDAPVSEPAGASKAAEPAKRAETPAGTGSAEERRTDETEKRRKAAPRMSFERTPRNSNALRINRIPLECAACGSTRLENVSMGIYICQDCGVENYDDYQTVRNYLDRVGMAPAVVIEKDTGVPRRVIDYFFRQEYLEIPKSSAIRVPCERCGAPIRTGTLCDACKSQRAAEKHTRGTWHSRR